MTHVLSEDAWEDDGGHAPAGVNPDLERVWSATVTFLSPPEGTDIDEYVRSCLLGMGGRGSTGNRYALYDLGHTERLFPTSLSVRVACTTANLLQLFRRALWQELRIAHVEVDELPESEEVGGEG